MQFVRNTQVLVEGGKYPAEVKAGEVFIYLDTCTPGVRTAEGMEGYVASQGGSPVKVVADACDLEAA